MIEIELSKTINLGNFESMKIQGTWKIELGENNEEFIRRAKVELREMIEKLYKKI